ncbi:uncharacterized protein LOC133173810 [Saccostrea echinata]|uniref:uncharacterized protein LOC133173810 n=1 Tax=Saccostrea echinata TaxID=191078 RepID=UPI002A7ED67C|nr:uncharacterized protein LOC133173810 [Saccostrea echinata]
MVLPREKIATLVILDLECTGLINPGARPRVTELCLLSVQREELLTPVGLPRVCNKLVMCINPKKMIDPTASIVTGLYNDALEAQSPFDDDTITSISHFVSRLPQPICLLAHNGNGYDFKILNAELKRIARTLPGEIYCADSLEALRALDTEAADVLSDPAQNTNNGASTATPVGQNIPEVPEQVIDVKGRVRQKKRKCDADFDRVPIEAKSIRKRLFDSAGKKDDEKNDDSIDLIGHKPIGSSLKMSADVISKRNTCDIESVKKRLSFDDDDEEEDDSEDKDVEMSDSEENHNPLEDKENVHSQHTIPASQGSLPDDDFLQAVENIEQSQSESRNKLNSETPICLLKTSDCVTPKEQTVSVLANCEGLCTPETPSTSGQTFTTVSNPQKDQCLTPMKEHCFTPQKEQCLTPMTGLVRSTAAFQLNTPVSGRNETYNVEAGKRAVPNGMACRSLFRSTTENACSGFKPGASPVSRFPPRVSYKLVDIYRRSFGQDPVNLHSAESDCVTLMKIIKQRSPAFIQWVDEHAVLLTSIQQAY